MQFIVELYSSAIAKLSGNYSGKNERIKASLFMHTNKHGVARPILKNKACRSIFLRHTSTSKQLLSLIGVKKLARFLGSNALFVSAFDLYVCLRKYSFLINFLGVS